MNFFYLNIFFTLFFSWVFNGSTPQLSIWKPGHIVTDTIVGPGVEATTVATGLDVPWEIIWGPDNKIWITEQKGLVSRIDPVTGEKQVILTIPEVWHHRTAGLLGMVLHPDMKNNPYVFLNYTFLKDKKPHSKLVRYTWKNEALVNPKVLLVIPGNNGHNGSRLTIWKGKLYWATGDAVTEGNAQNVNSLNGKILRLNFDGSIPKDNPRKGSAVWAWGFRNMQGLVFSKKGYLYSSEHGDATEDEVNLLTPNRNYGWPTVQGFAENEEETEFKKAKQTVDPVKAWTPTIAPAGLDYYYSDGIPGWKNSLLLVTLKGKSLRVLKLSEDGRSIINEDVLFENEYGRLRDVCISPAGDVYISTSNHDWNPMGKPIASDDRIIKISKSDKPFSKPVLATNQVLSSTATGATLYVQYCASCHKEDGKGMEGIFPPLVGSERVNSAERALVAKVLKGSTGPAVINGVKYDITMPSFAFLKDEQVADILTYVRQLGVNETSPVSVNMVKEVRREVK